MKHLLRVCDQGSTIAFPAFKDHRLARLLLAGDLLVAFWRAAHEALVSISLESGCKYYAADPQTFLAASLMVLSFGAGLFSADGLLMKECTGAHESI